MCVFAGILGGPIAENGLAITRSEGRIWYLGHQTAVMTQEGMGGATSYRERVSGVRTYIGASWCLGVQVACLYVIFTHSVPDASTHLP
jgi:hypothetical protein